MLDKLKNYVVYINCKPLTYDVTYFEPQPFLANRKIVGLQIFDSAVLTTTPTGNDICFPGPYRVNLTMQDLDNLVVIDEIPGQVFAQYPVTTFEKGGNIVRFRPFIANWQKCFIQNTNSISNGTYMGFNFYYI